MPELIINCLYNVIMVDNYSVVAKYLRFERGFFVFEEIDSKKLLPIAKSHILTIGVNDESKPKK